MANERQYLTVAETAKLVRAALYREFPNIPKKNWSVRSSSYSMGASITVEWIDGPATRTVDEVIQAFQRVSHMDNTDLVHYRQGTVHPETGQPVSFGADYVSSRRRYTKDFMARIANAYTEAWGQEPVEITDGADPTVSVSKGHGSAYITRDSDRIHSSGRGYISNEIYRAAQRISASALDTTDQNMIAPSAKLDYAQDITETDHNHLWEARRERERAAELEARREAGRIEREMIEVTAEEAEQLRADGVEVTETEEIVGYQISPEAIIAAATEDTRPIVEPDANRIEHDVDGDVGIPSGEPEAPSGNEPALSQGIPPATPDRAPYLSTYNGHPVIVVTMDNGREFRFGLRKARAVARWIEEITEFAESEE
jgi:hypothetical protein